VSAALQRKDINVLQKKSRKKRGDSRYILLFMRLLVKRIIKAHLHMYVNTNYIK